ncbi:MAG: zinc-dependent metalloprotease [Bifidobacteriaceae bacterium]|jgi:putative hydrolase|nr:zinc-dependent metalloprotease [Bifidobacteriaceae bacterium]
MSAENGETPTNGDENENLVPENQNLPDSYDNPAGNQKDSENASSDAKNDSVNDSGDKQKSDDLFKWMNDNYADLNEALKNIESQNGIMSPNDLEKFFQSGNFPNMQYPFTSDAEMMRNLNQMFNSPEFLAVMSAINSPPDKRGKVDSTLVKQFAKQGTRNVPVLSSDTELTRNAYSVANLWVDAQTEFSPRQAKIQTITKQDWIDIVADELIKISDPINKSFYALMTEIIDQQIGEDSEANMVMNISNSAGFTGPVPFMSDASLPDILKSLSGVVSSTRLARVVAELSEIVFSEADLLLPIVKNPLIIFMNLTERSKGLDVPFRELLQYIIVRSVAYDRLFYNVKWLRDSLFSLVKNYADTVDFLSLDLIDLDEEFTFMDPGNLQETLMNELVNVEKTEDQQRIIDRLGTLFGLIEGWIDFIATQSSIANLSHTMQIREILRRRNATQSPVGLLFGALFGAEFNDIYSGKYYKFWQTVTQKFGFERRDSFWKHPDSLPTDEKEIELPEMFISRIERQNSESATNDTWDEAILGLISSFDEKEGDKSAASDDKTKEE